MQYSIEDLTNTLKENMSGLENDPEQSPVEDESDEDVDESSDDEDDDDGEIAQDCSQLRRNLQNFQLSVVTSFACVQNQVDLLASELDDQEMRHRRNMLLVHGIPEEEDEDIVEMMVALLQDRLGLTEFESTEIVRAHRIGRIYSENKNRLIMVEFKNYLVRNEVWFAKSNLRGTKIIITEFLTKRRYELFKECREKMGFFNCWTRRGYIIVLGHDGYQHRVASRIDLDKLIGLLKSEVTCIAPPPFPVLPSSSGVRSDALLRGLVTVCTRCGKTGTCRTWRNIVNEATDN